MAQYDVDGFGTPFSQGIRIVWELTAGSADEAVSIAEQASEALARVTAFCVGAPHNRPRVVSLLEITPGLQSRLYSQWCYDVLPVTASREVQPPEIETMLQSLSARPPKEAEAITRGLKWYTDALNEDDLIDRFLKAWVGLESIGAILNQRLHRSGWRNCKQCLGSEADRSADERQERGMRHLLSHVEPSIPDLFPRLKKNRNKLVHGEWSLARIRAEIEPSSPTVSKALCSGLLTALASPGTQAGSRQAFEPVPVVPGGPQVRVSLDVLSPDPDVWGELNAKLTVKATVERSTLDGGQYAARVGLRVEAESPCRVQNPSAKSLLRPEHGMELTIDSEGAQLHTREVRTDVGGSQPGGRSGRGHE